MLKILIGDESLFKQYLFDQQFAHQGWSGMFSVIEDQPQTLLEQKKPSIHDLIVFELLLEIDALEFHFGKDWVPMSSRIKNKPEDLFDEVHETELDEVTTIWQEAFEWTYYDEVLAGIKMEKPQRVSRFVAKAFRQCSASMTVNVLYAGILKNLIRTVRHSVLLGSSAWNSFINPRTANFIRSFVLHRLRQNTLLKRWAQRKSEGRTFTLPNMRTPFTGVG